MQDDSIVRVPLTQGKFAVIDALDAERVLGFGKWRIIQGRYVGRSVKIPGTRKSNTVYLHHFLSGCPEDTDHIDRDTLNNRRKNLRCATRAQNTANSVRRRSNTSGFKGVGWHKRGGRWRAQIRIKGRQIHLGHFSTAEEAARAYDDAARAEWGEFAYLNFPD